MKKENKFMKSLIVGTFLSFFGFMILAVILYFVHFYTYVIIGKIFFFSAYGTLLSLIAFLVIIWFVRDKYEKKLGSKLVEFSMLIILPGVFFIFFIIPMTKDLPYVFSDDHQQVEGILIAEDYNFQGRTDFVDIYSVDGEEIELNYFGSVPNYNYVKATYLPNTMFGLTFEEVKQPTKVLDARIKQLAEDFATVDYLVPDEEFGYEFVSVYLNSEWEERSGQNKAESIALFEERLNQEVLRSLYPNKSEMQVIDTFYYDQQGNLVAH